DGDAAGVAADTDEAGGAAGAGSGLNQASAADTDEAGAGSGPNRASAADTARIAAALFGPPMAGTLVRRWHFVAEQTAQWDLSGGSLRVMRLMRRRYGTAPLRLKLLKPRVYVVLDPADVDEVMRTSPGPPGASGAPVRPIPEVIDRETARISTFLAAGHTF